MDETYMRRALALAEKGRGFVSPNPLVGAVLVKDGRVIGEGWHQKAGGPHAEVYAVRSAAEPVRGATAYVTLEPCQMCAGAIIQSRMDRVVIGCMNPKAGCAGSVLNLLQVDRFNHQADVTRGVLEEKCSELMKSFFRELREKKKKKEGA